MDLKTAGRSLRRIRFAETEELGKQGKQKRVWHQGEGVDVTTRVNWLGRAVQHELSMGGRYLHWTRDGGVRTAHEDDGDRSVGKKASVLLSYDAALDQPLVMSAVELLDAAAEDRYLQHFAGVLREVLAPAMPFTDDEVTRMSGAGPRPTAAPPKKGLLAKLLGR